MEGEKKHELTIKARYFWNCLCYILILILRLFFCLQMYPNQKSNIWMFFPSIVFVNMIWYIFVCVQFCCYITVIYEIYNSIFDQSYFNSVKGMNNLCVIPSSSFSRTCQLWQPWRKGCTANSNFKLSILSLSSLSFFASPSQISR